MLSTSEPTPEATKSTKYHTLNIPQVDLRPSLLAVSLCLGSGHRRGQFNRVVQGPVHEVVHGQGQVEGSTNWESVFSGYPVNFTIQILENN